MRSAPAEWQWCTLARDLRHEREVALKVLKPELGAVLGTERFLSEIRVTAKLQHPNLLPLFDSGRSRGRLARSRVSGALSLWMTFLHLEPRLRHMRGTQRFEELVKRVGVAPARENFQGSQ